MIANRTELATEANTKLRQHGLDFRNYKRRIKFSRSNSSADKAWRMLQIVKVAEDTVFNLTENQLEALISALYRLGGVSVNDFLTN